MMRTVSAAMAIAAALMLPAAAQQQPAPQQQPSAQQQQPPAQQQQPSPQDQEARQQFEQDAKAWQDAYNRKDAQALAEMYAPDAVLSGGTIATGRDAIERQFETEFREGHMANLAITVERAQSAGPDHAWAIGTWRGEASMPAIAMMQRQGQGMPMQQRQGGPMQQGQGGPMMQGQGGPMMQGQGGPMMQGQGGPMMQGQGSTMPPGPRGQRAIAVEGHWLIVAERSGGQSQILAHVSNLAMPAGACPMCGAMGATPPQENR